MIPDDAPAALSRRHIHDARVALERLDDLRDSLAEIERAAAAQPSGCRIPVRDGALFIPWSVPLGYFRSRVQDAEATLRALGVDPA